MSGLRELARARLRELGQDVGQSWDKAPSNVVPLPQICPNPVGQDLPQNTANNEPCPTVPATKAWDSGTSRGSAGTNSGTQSGTSDHLAAARCREWRAYLMRLSPTKPFHGLGQTRWACLLDEADWLFENYAGQAARDGWSSLDLFGVLPGRDGCGGIADRLRGSRSLMMSSDVARWRRVVNGEPESFARGLGATVEMVPLWGPSS